MSLAPVQLVPAIPADAEEIRALAESIWWDVYPVILDPEQIRFMLEWMYAPKQLRSEMAGGHVSYDFLEFGAERAGYCSQHAGTDEGEIHLAKFYLAKRLHGRGLGSAALQALIRRARSADASSITLRVNRHNQPALRCYLRNGFRVIRDLTTPIGGGFVMDDHWMRLDLE
jgi:ribosomal protein S18 acetylase RimI-like enzyme